ncbi:MAG: dihydrodipicolinate synthase family protein [Armatimonadota bacterium]|nr:dihydrodipicolinate synthase family protein [Armatimonadota bacterium]
MDRHSVTWEGNFNAVVTPFAADGSVDAEKFVRNLTLLIDEGIDGLVVTGCTGEFWALDRRERIELYRLAVATAAGRVPVICGTSAIRTSEVIELSRAAETAGAQGVMITPPFYALPSPREIAAHYQTISDQIGLPILVYNIPKRQAVGIGPELLQRLADVDKVVAIKQSAPSFDDVTQAVALVGDRIRIFAGHSVTRGFPAIAMGCDGYVSSVEPQVMGREAIELFRLSRRGDVAAARALQYRCIALDEAIHGVGTFPASLKAAMNLVGRPGGYPREPLLPLTAEEQQRLERVLTALGLLAAVPS